jgi:hypothetical protein
MDIDYSEQQATEDAINASYSYCYFQNIWIHIKEGNLSDIVVWDSVTFANRRMRVNLNNTGNTFRVVRFQRLKSWLTMYASGGYTEYQYNNATITYKCIPIV